MIDDENTKMSISITAPWTASWLKTLKSRGPPSD